MSDPLASPRVLIVEDEIFVASDLEATLEELGYQPVGIAPDTDTALKLAGAGPDIALVDLNLRDGETGAVIGERLGAQGVAVLFVTANPRCLGRGVPGTFGVISKPLDGDGVARAISWVTERRRGIDAAPPEGIHAFG